LSGDGTYSFAISSASTNSAYYSSRQGANPPQLVVAYEPGGGGLPPAPVPNFTATPTTGSPPLSVSFTDSSTNSPTSWAWDFDNNGSVDSTAQNPTFQYVSSGTYSVKLSATNAGGTGSVTKTNYITVADGPPPAPVANFAGTPTSGAAPLSVAFTDSSTNSPTSWAWDFQNDGTVDSTQQNPTFVYTTAGAYSVKLVATNAGGSGSVTKSGYVNVSASPPPSASFTVVAAADARVSQAFPTSNYGSDVSLRVRLDPTGDHRSYVRFAVTGISGTVTSVKLRLFVTDPSSASGTVYPTTTWTESTLNWNNAPAASGPLIRTIGATALNTWVEVDLTGAITANGTYNFVIQDGSTNSAFYSSREGAHAPELVISQTP
jgi:PKD repeat protein